MSSPDWKDSLQSLLAGGSLPEGEAPETAPEPAPVPGPMKLNVVVERKGHKGKTVTIIEGFDCPDDELRTIASDLKRHLGVGGSARDGEILVQGDRREAVMAWLRGRGLVR